MFEIVFASWAKETVIKNSFYSSVCVYQLQLITMVSECCSDTVEQFEMDDISHDTNYWLAFLNVQITTI